MISTTQFLAYCFLGGMVGAIGATIGFHIVSFSLFLMMKNIVKIKIEEYNEK